MCRLEQWTTRTPSHQTGVTQKRRNAAPSLQQGLPPAKPIATSRRTHDSRPTRKTHTYSCRVPHRHTRYIIHAHTCATCILASACPDRGASRGPSGHTAVHHPVIRAPALLKRDPVRSGRRGMVTMTFVFNPDANELDQTAEEGHRHSGERIRYSYSFWRGEVSGEERLGASRGRAQTPRQRGRECRGWDCLGRLNPAFRNKGMCRARNHKAYLNRDKRGNTERKPKKKKTQGSHQASASKL